MKNPVAIMLSIILVVSASIACSEKKTSSDTGPEPSDTTTIPLAPITVLRSDLNYPWEILWGKDNHIWMTERNGRISKLKPSDGSTVFSHTISDVVSRGEGGLLGMAQDPGFNTNGFIYVVYNYQKNAAYTEKVVRLTLTNGMLENPMVILDDIPASSIHNGSRLWVTETPDSKIYISTGDASSSGQAQNLNSLSGKILRLNTDGTIPADNPFPGNPVWSFGHRNPQGMVFADGKLFTAEHGPSIEDEVNLVTKGKNHGWPEVNGPCNGNETSFCNSASIAEPIWSSGSSTFAISGMDYYNNERIPEWKNSLLVASLKNATLYVLKLNDNKTAVTSTSSYFSGSYGRLRDVCISPEGTVFICTSNGGSNDKLIAINKP